MNHLNIAHLRKQAKSLVRLYPALVADHPSAISLAVAQSLVANLNGYPNWEALAGSTQQKTRVKQNAPSDAIDLSQYLHFDIDDEASRLPLAYSEETGNPTRHKKGFNAILCYKNKDDEALAYEEDSKLDDLFEQASGSIIDASYVNLQPETRFWLLDAVSKSLGACPFCIETYGRMAGLLQAERLYDQAIALIEPLIMQLAAMIPGDRYIQVNYGFLANRPFHRLVHNYVLSLDKVGATTTPTTGQRRW